MQDLKPKKLICLDNSNNQPEQINAHQAQPNQPKNLQAPNTGTQNIANIFAFIIVAAVILGIATFIISKMSKKAKKITLSIFMLATIAFSGFNGFSKTHAETLIDGKPCQTTGWSEYEVGVKIEYDHMDEVIEPWKNNPVAMNQFENGVGKYLGGRFKGSGDYGNNLSLVIKEMRNNIFHIDRTPEGSIIVGMLWFDFLRNNQLILDADKMQNNTAYIFYKIEKSPNWTDERQEYIFKIYLTYDKDKWNFGKDS